jgi:hypothetical protein
MATLFLGVLIAASTATADGNAPLDPVVSQELITSQQVTLGGGQTAVVVIERTARRSSFHADHRVYSETTVRVDLDGENGSAVFEPATLTLVYQDGSRVVEQTVLGLLSAQAETDFYRPIDNPLVGVEIEHQDRRVSVQVPAH